MALTKDGQGPYAPTPAVLAVITAYRERSPRFPLTNENVAMVEGVTESLAPRTLQALKLLDLVDENGEPTPAFKGLKEAGRNEFPMRLAEVVQEAYAEIFAYRDPTTAEPADIQDAFRGYRPSSMRDRMVRLFYGLCEASGLIAQAPKIMSDAPKAARTPRATGAQPGKNKQTVDERSAAPSEQPTRATREPVTDQVGRHKLLPGLVAALVDKLPAEGETWTAKDAEWWLQMAEMAFPREYSFAPTKDAS